MFNYLRNEGVQYHIVPLPEGKGGTRAELTTEDDPSRTRLRRGDPLCNLTVSRGAETVGYWRTNDFKLLVVYQQLFTPRSLL